MNKKTESILRKISIFTGVLILFLIAFILIFYFCNPLGSFTKTFFKVIPYPIAVIDQNNVVTTKDLLSSSESIEKFYNNQDFSEIGLRIDFDTEEGKQRLKIKEKEVFNKLIENELVVLVSNSKGIIITKKEAEEELVMKAREAGDMKNLATSLKNLYNWSLSDFRDQVILPRLYLKNLLEYHENEILPSQGSGGIIKKAYQDLQDGDDFEEVAKKYSEGETATNGGALGWFKKEYLSDSLSESAYSMEVGDFSEIITTPLGSHIIYLEETRKEDEQTEVKIKQIFTSEGSFLNWFNGEKKMFNVKIFTKDYTWDIEDQRIIFSNEELERKEDYLRNNSMGDPSVY